MSEHRETPLTEGEIVSARVDEQGVLRTQVVENGELRGHDYGREGFTREGVYYPPPPITEDILPAPVPVEVAITPTDELDAIVHAMAMEAEQSADGRVIELEPEPVAPTEVTNGTSYTVVERDQYGDLREHTYDTEAVTRPNAAPVQEFNASLIDNSGLEFTAALIDDPSVNDSSTIVHEGLHDSRDDDDVSDGVSSIDSDGDDDDSASTGE